ncbi:TPA: hypothetical protein L5A09_006558 [Pseudomonas aeruginosa]|nr:hypothetical protein [Pseudomonas aeruginosa]
MKLLSLLKAGVISLMAGIATAHAGDSTTLGTSADLPMNLPIATEGTACSAVGLTAFSNTGLLLSCQSGSWINEGNRFGGFYVNMGANAELFCGYVNPKTGGCNCPPGHISYLTGFSYSGSTPYMWYRICQK